MSKDFTPRDILKINEQFDNLYLKNITITDEYGNKKSFFTDEEQEIRLKYPLFAMAFGDMFLKLWYDLPAEKRDSTFEDMERIMRNLKVMDEENDFRACDPKVKDWYFGKLDANYYYNDVNNNMFYDWIIKNIVYEV
jgi:hypothetical protein